MSTLSPSRHRLHPGMTAVTDLKRHPTRDEAPEYKVQLACGHSIDVDMTEFYDLLIERQHGQPERRCPQCGS